MWLVFRDGILQRFGTDYTIEWNSMTHQHKVIFTGRADKDGFIVPVLESGRVTVLSIQSAEDITSITEVEVKYD